MQVDPIVSVVAPHAVNADELDHAFAGTHQTGEALHARHRSADPACVVGAPRKNDAVRVDDRDAGIGVQVEPLELDELLEVERRCEGSVPILRIVGACVVGGSGDPSADRQDERRK